MYQEVASILGLRSGKRTGSLEIAQSIEAGFPSSAIDRLKADLDITDQLLSTLIGRTPKTLGRMRVTRSHRLSSIVSDRLFRVAKVYARAREVFEDAASAREWLHTPQIGLKERVPLDLLVTEAGARAVEDLLTRIEHGVLS